MSKLATTASESARGTYSRLEITQRGLRRCFRLDQHVVGGGHFGDGDVEQGAEGGVPSVAAIEAKGEFVEIGLQVFPAQAVIDAECPAFEVGEDAMRPRQDDVGGH